MLHHVGSQLCSCLKKSSQIETREFILELIDFFLNFDDGPSVPTVALSEGRNPGDDN